MKLYYLQVADLYSYPDPQEPVHLPGPQQLPVAGLVRGCGRQPARPHGEQGTSVNPHSIVNQHFL